MTPRWPLAGLRELLRSHPADVPGPASGAGYDLVCDRKRAVISRTASTAFGRISSSRPDSAAFMPDVAPPRAGRDPQPGRQLRESSIPSNSAALRRIIPSFLDTGCGWRSRSPWRSPHPRTLALRCSQNRLSGYLAVDHVGNTVRGCREQGVEFLHEEVRVGTRSLP
jgi:hypothetical protein